MAKKPSKGKDKKLQRKAELEKILVLQGKVKELKQVPDILENFPAFRQYQRQGLDLELQYFHAEAMSASLHEQLFALCKENMEDAYNSAWGWDDKAKRDELTSSDARFIVVFNKAAADQEALAFVHLRFEEEEGLLVLYTYEIQLDKRVQRKGLGKYLMQLVELFGRRQGLEALMLTVMDVNDAAIQLYAKLGYTLDRTSPGLEDLVDGEKPPGYRILSKRLPAGKPARPVLKEANGSSTTSMAAPSLS